MNSVAAMPKANIEAMKPSNFSSPSTCGPSRMPSRISNTTTGTLKPTRHFGQQRRQHGSGHDPEHGVKVGHGGRLQARVDSPRILGPSERTATQPQGRRMCKGKTFATSRRAAGCTIRSQSPQELDHGHPHPFDPPGPRLRRHTQAIQDRLGPRRAVLLAAGTGQDLSEHQAAAGVDPHRARIGAAQLRRQEGRRRACGAARQLAAERAAQRRDPLRRGPRGAAGLHRRAAAGRPGGDAQRGRRHGPRCQDHRAAGAGGPGGRPLGDGRPLRHARGAGPEHEAGVPAQPGALPVHEVGHAGLRHLRRGAAGLRHRAPGEPGVPGARRAQGHATASTTPTRWSAPTATRR